MIISYGMERNILLMLGWFFLEEKLYFFKDISFGLYKEINILSRVF